jgi:hypothetical protein
VVWMVDQGLKIPLQVGPAPRRPADVPIHLGPVAVDHAIEGVGAQFLKDRGGPGGPQRKDRIVAGDEGSQPALFSRPSFVGDSSIPSTGSTGNCAASSS